MKTFIAFSFLLASVVARAQVFPVQVSTHITPPYSPYLSDYAAPGAQNFTVNIFAKDLTLSDYPFKLRLTIEGPGITLRTKPGFAPAPFHLQGGAALTLYGDDLHEYLHPANLDFSGLPYSEYSRTTRLPDGIYRFSIEVLDYNRGTVVSNKGMTSVWVNLNDPQAAQETLPLEAGTHVFVLSGVLEVEHEGLWVTARGSMLLEVGKPLRVRAQEATRLILLSRDAAPEERYRRP